MISASDVFLLLSQKNAGFSVNLAGAFLSFLCVFALGGPNFTAQAQEHGSGKSCCSVEKNPKVLHEMVPHIILPKTIQYKPAATTLSNPGWYPAQKDYPATYVAYPSYTLPFPTEMRSVRQAVYPALDGKTASLILQVAEKEIAKNSANPGSAPQFQRLPFYPRPHIQPLQVPKNESQENKPAVPRSLNSGDLDHFLDENGNFGDIELYLDSSEGEESEPAIPENSEEPPQNTNIDPENVVKKSTQNHSGKLRLAQYGGTSLLPSAPTLPHAPSFVSNPYGSTPGYSNVIRPLKPIPDPQGESSPYLGGQSSPYSPQQSTDAYIPPSYAQHGSPYARQQTVQGAVSSGQIPGNQPQITAQQAQQQAQQWIQSNPQMQFSAVAVGPNGQLVPINTGVNQCVSPGTSPQISQAYQEQIARQQMQYIQAMNQYVQQLSTGAVNSCGHPTTAYFQPIPGSPGAYPMSNPYYANPYYGATSGGMVPGSPYVSQQFQSQPYPVQFQNGYGIMVNPYYPMPQVQSGASGSQGESYKPPRERLRDRIRNKEKQMCEAWKAPHYPPDTGVRVPSKEAYPYGHFGAHVAPSETANFGGYYNMHFGNSVCPGQ